MGKQKSVEYRQGRRILAELPTGSDLISGLVDLCNRYSVKIGRFRATGRVQSATIGVYDQSQEVYGTHLEEKATEVLSCTGSVDTHGEDPTVNAKIILADQQGHLAGGHLFANTISQEVEIDLQELLEIEQ
jgi:predicted DNA-binding protein with PD1-like motif